MKYAKKKLKKKIPVLIAVILALLFGVVYGFITGNCVIIDRIIILNEHNSKRATRSNKYWG